MDSTIRSTPHPSSPGPGPGPMRFCGLCRKPFLKGNTAGYPLRTGIPLLINYPPETTYNRHMLYCRRNQNRPRTRARACRPCSLAKVKCNLQQPQCLRCTNKALECVYEAAAAPVTTAAADGGQVVAGRSAEAVAQDSTPDSLAGIGSSNDSYNPSAARDPDEAQTDMDWDTLDFVTSDILSQSPKSNIPTRFPELSQRDILKSPFVPGSCDDSYTVNSFDTNLDHWSLSLADVSFSEWPDLRGVHHVHTTALARPTCLSERPQSDFLSPIPMPDPASNCAAVVVMQMLRAFPQMMLRRETFPPFIHGHWYCPSDSTDSPLPKPLVSCMGIAQVFASRNLDTRPFLWLMVQGEQRSAAAKVRSLPPFACWWRP
jgi:hypothetical protein